MNKKLVFNLIIFGAVAVGGAVAPALSVFAIPVNYSIDIASTVLDEPERTVTLQGTAGANPYTGSLSAVHVGVTDWGDGGRTVPVSDFVIVSSSASPKTFSATWSATHTYAGPGEYIVTAMAYHGEVSEDNEQYAAATTTVTVRPRIVAVAGDGGTIAPAGTMTVGYHGDQTFTMVPSGGGTVGALLIDGVSTTTADSYTFTDITDDHTIDVRFISGPTRTLTATTTGEGTGTIASDPAGISCGTAGAVCTANFPKDATVTLTASPDVPTSTFEGWGGACASAGTSSVCTVTMSADAEVSAAFGIQTYALTVATGGTGDGVITDASGTIYCDSADATSSVCMQVFAIGTPVTLFATPDASSTFALWSTGPCAGATSTSCSFSIDSATTGSTIVAVFSGPMIIPQADLSVEKTAEATSTAPGSIVRYRIAVANLGPATSTGITAEDLLPDGLMFMNATTSIGSYESSTGAWLIGTLSAGSGATLDLSALVDPGIDASAITNTASVAGDEWSEDLNLSNNSSSITLPVISGGGGTIGPDLAVSKAVDNANPDPGTGIVYSIMVENSGDAPAAFVTGNDTWPTALTFANATSSQGSLALVGNGVNWEVGTLEPHATATMTIAMTVGQGEAGNTIVNTATVSSTLGSFTDPTPEDNTSSVTVVVRSGGSNDGTNGNNNTGGGGGATVGVAAGGRLAPIGQGLVLGASTTAPAPIVVTAPPAEQGQVLGASTTCGYYLTGYITPARYANGQNDPVEVMKLQVFLNKELGLNIPISGYYGPVSEAAVRQFQLKYSSDVLAPWVPHGLVNAVAPTGYVYKTTQRLINMIMCPSLNLPIPQLP